MIPKEELYLLEIEINRSSEAELTIFLKGKNQWKSLSASSNKTFLIGGIECFYPKDQQLDGISSSFYADSVFEINNYPNLNLLLAKDIETGVTFNFGKYPITDEKIDNFKNKFYEQVKILYLTYLKPVNVKAIITTQTVEIEEHG